MAFKPLPSATAMRIEMEFNTCRVSHPDKQTDRHDVPGAASQQTDRQTRAGWHIPTNRQTDTFRLAIPTNRQAALLELGPGGMVSVRLQGTDRPSLFQPKALL
jgi:hypothetical protein